MSSILSVLKLLYESVGAQHPRASLLVIAALGAVLAGAGWWLLGQQYEKDRGAPPPAQKLPAQPAGPPAATPLTTSLQGPSRTPDVAVATRTEPAIVEGQVRSVAELRDRMRLIGASEHVADNRSVFLAHYPTLVKSRVNPMSSSTDADRPTGLSGGRSLELIFEDVVHGFGVYIKQGLYPCSVIIYLADRSQRALTAQGYRPNVEFVGMASTIPIERVILQPQASGDVEFQGFYISSRRLHKRDLTAK